MLLKTCHLMSGLHSSNLPEKNSFTMRSKIPKKAIKQHSLNILKIIKGDELNKILKSNCQMKLNFSNTHKYTIGDAVCYKKSCYLNLIENYKYEYIFKGDPINGFRCILKYKIYKDKNYIGYLCGFPNKEMKLPVCISIIEKKRHDNMKTFVYFFDQNGTLIELNPKKILSGVYYIYKMGNSYVLFMEELGHITSSILIVKVNMVDYYIEIYEYKISDLNILSYDFKNITNELFFVVSGISAEIEEGGFFILLIRYNKGKMTIERCLKSDFKKPILDVRIAKNREGVLLVFLQDNTFYVIDNILSPKEEYLAYKINEYVFDLFNFRNQIYGIFNNSIKPLFNFPLDYSDIFMLKSCRINQKQVIIKKNPFKAILFKREQLYK